MEGFEKFKKDSFDLCILDVMMPYKDGYTLAREIREKNKEVPIIFLTAKSMKEDVLKGYKVGADDYLNKPFDSEVLLMKIKAIIQRKASETKTDNSKFEFQIGKFHLNSKLRFLTYDNDEPIKLSPKENELLKMLIVGFFSLAFSICSFFNNSLKFFNFPVIRLPFGFRYINRFMEGLR